MSLLKYLVLPREITPFERTYITRLNKIALIFFYLHVPVFMLMAWIVGTGSLTALGLTLFVVSGPTIAYRTFRNPRHISVMYGITAMLMGGLLVHFGQGPVQIEMHFYFFALIAMLCMFANPAVNIAAAVTVALHHLIVWLIVPGSVFNYDAQWWVVLVHAGFVVLETIACCFISRSFFDNVIGLEKIVAARTETIREKQRDMRLILDNVETGLITIDMAGRMSSECSQTVTHWFGEPVANAPLSAWLGERDPSFGEWLELGLETVAEGMLPRDVALAQLPRLLKADRQTYAVQYQTILDGAGEPEKILVIITDISERLRSEAAGRYQAELLQMFQHIMRDKHGFIEFLAEAEAIVATLQSGKYSDMEHWQRLVDTLKGNAAIFGMQLIAEHCHELENHVAAEGTAPSADALGGLYQAWSQIQSDLSHLIGEHRQTSVVVDDSDYRTILKAVLDGADSGVLLRMIGSWRLQPTAKRLSLIEQQIHGIAARMGKDNVTVVTASHDLRLDAQRFGPFWSSFIHILRNAVDHGTEGRQARLTRGKPEQCVIAISTTLEGDRFVVTVEDDGPGIDWAALQSKAAQLGVDVGNGSAEHVIFLPGVSAMTTVNEYSGRGIGMGAVREACEALGGTVEISAGRDGGGARFRFLFPGGDVYEGHAALLTRDLTQHVATV